jgi:hypothetical protein
MGIAACLMKAEHLRRIALDVKLFSDMLVTIIEMKTFNLNPNLKLYFYFFIH